METTFQVTLILPQIFLVARNISGFEDLEGMNRIRMNKFMELTISFTLNGEMNFVVEAQQSDRVNASRGAHVTKQIAFCFNSQGDEENKLPLIKLQF